MIKKCTGCGVELQTENKEKEGFVEDINNKLCTRCFKLKNYGEYKEVSLDNEDFTKILKEIPKDSLVVYLTSLLNINLDYLENLNNVILVLTKKDLLPKSVQDYKLINYIKNITNNYLDIEIISTIKNYNLDNLLNKIKKYNKNNNKVYFVGMTNSGKSTLINKMIKNYTDKEIEVTTSIYPSTTLDKVEIELGDIKIIDTPGLLNRGSILKNITLKEIKKITPKKEIKPRSYQLKGKGSLLIEDYIRLDYYADNNITIYIANNLNITKMTQNNPKLKENKKITFNLEEGKDIVVEDLCFIKFTKKGKVDIYTKYDVNIYERKNLI